MAHIRESAIDLASFAVCVPRARKSAAVFRDIAPPIRAERPGVYSPDPPPFPAPNHRRGPPLVAHDPPYAPAQSGLRQVSAVLKSSLIMGGLKVLQG
jgi:hypothetical protein